VVAFDCLAMAKRAAFGVDTWGRPGGGGGYLLARITIVQFLVSRNPSVVALAGLPGQPPGLDHNRQNFPGLQLAGRS
jgi:hypothetical protein